MNERLEGARLRSRYALAFGVALAMPVLLGVMRDPAPAGDPSALERGRQREAIEARDRVVRERTMDELLTDAEQRIAAIEHEAARLESFYVSDVDPLVRDLIWLGGDTLHAKRIAVALVREGIRNQVDPRLLLAVMRVENPWLDLGALSPVGAIGLMQVMPFHAGGWGCGGDDLTDLDLNICHGTKILAGLIDRFDGNVERALLLYNGCVRGSNTRDCYKYPSMVLANLGSWAGPAPHGTPMD
jgi:hypothetical protein